MYKPRYIQYLNLPKIPNDIITQAISNIPACIEKYSKPNSNYIWTDFDNKNLDAWCKKNICADIYFAFQIMTGDLKIHKDIGTQIKFCYIIEPGGDNVLTTFYGEDSLTPLDSYLIEAEKWHILKVDTYHGVTNMEPNKIRFSVTGRIFE